MILKCWKTICLKEKVRRNKRKFLAQLMPSPEIFSEANMFLERFWEYTAGGGKAMQMG